MEQNQTALRNGDKTEDQPGQKTNEDYNGKTPHPYDPDFTKLYPDKEVPNIVAHDKELTEDAKTDNHTKEEDREASVYLDTTDE